MSDKDKAAPVGEREAFEAWFFCPSNSLLAEWEDAAWEAFQAGAAHQRQVHAEHEGPDYCDGPEFDGWAGRSGQQAREVVMPEVLEDLELVRVALRGFLPCIARTEGLRAVSRVIARLNKGGSDE